MSENQRSGFKKVTHCIFDVDGLLLDTEQLYTQAAEQILSQYGETLTFEMKLKCMGLQSRDVAESIVAAYNLPITWEEYSQQHRVQIRKLMINPLLMRDTEVIYEEIVRQIAAGFNKPYPIEVRTRLLGSTEQRSAEIAISELGLPLTLDEYLERFNEMCYKWLGDVTLLKGAERLLRHLHEHRIPITFATSSSKSMMEIKITNHREVFALFHHGVCGSSDPEVKQGKPAPDIFLIAASRFEDNPEPAQCLVFEDAPNGVRAANSAGMQVVMVPEERVPEAMRAGATQVLKSLEDFKPEDFGLPAFPACTC